MLASRRVAHHAEVLAEKVGEPYGSMTLTLAAVLVEVVILGIAAVLGGLRHGEQPYNVDSGNTYVVMILTAIGISMIVPAFLSPAAGSYFFSYSYAETGVAGHGHPGSAHASIVLLVVAVISIGLLAEVMAKTLDAGLAESGVPPNIAAVVVAFISASPEILTAVRAAIANRMQPVVNIALGASLSTVILTVPIMRGLALFEGKNIIMALSWLTDSGPAIS